MKAARIANTGGSDQIRIEEVAVPVPRQDEVLVKVAAAGVNPIDWKIREGYFPQALPLTLGQDFAGTVEQIGPAAACPLSIGEAVYGMLPTSALGSYAEFLIARPEWLAPMPTGLSWAQAAALPMPILTAVIAIVDRGAVKSGERVLVHGAAGAVGNIAVQLSKSREAWVAGTARGAGLKLLADLGVDCIIDFANERFEDVLRRVGPVDFVFDIQGGEIRERSWSVLKSGGRLVSALGNAEPPPAAVARNVRGLPGFGASPDGMRLAEMADALRGGALRALPVREYSLHQTAEAMDLSQRGGSGAKAIIVMPSFGLGG